MLLALISDTHIRGEGPLLPTRCLDLVAGADLVVHAGDMADLEALERIRAIGPPVIAVRGNVDDKALASVLSEVEEVVIAGFTIGVIHDAGPSRGRLERMRRLFPSAAAVVFGHSRVPLPRQRWTAFKSSILAALQCAVGNPATQWALPTSTENESHSNT